STSLYSSELKIECSNAGEWKKQHNMNNYFMINRKGIFKLRKFLGFLMISTLLVLAACGGSGEASGDKESKTVTIGYFPNLNHAPAMVAKQKKMYKDHLEKNVNVEYQTFPDGSTFMKALAAGEIQG